MTNRKLRDYQVRMLDYCSKVQHPALFVQMRLGKTIVCIRSIRIRDVKKVLVIAPYSALYGWRDELCMEGQESKGIVELYGSRADRLNLLDMEYESSKWFLLNKEGHLVIPEVASYHWDAVVCDESTFLKGARSGVQEFYVNNFRDAAYRYVLTGTPAPEGELDYYNQMRFLSHTYWKEKNYWEFRFKNFGIFNHEAIISPEGSRYIARTLARRCFFLARHEVNLGGTKIYEKRFVQLSPKMRKVYSRVEREFVLAYKGIEQETIYATTKYVWLRRLCGGFVDTQFVSNVKLLELKYLLESELKNEKTLILCKHVAEVEQVGAYLKQWYRVGIIYGKVDKRIERPAIIKAMQTGKLDHIVAQPVTVRHGTNLSVLDTIIFYTSPDGGETREQVEDRMVDTSSNKSKLVIDLVCKDTVEEDALKSLKRKESKQIMMRNTVKRLQEKYHLER